MHCSSLHYTNLLASKHPNSISTLASPNRLPPREPEPRWNDAAASLKVPTGNGLGEESRIIWEPYYLLSQEYKRFWLVTYASPYYDEGCTAKANRYDSGRGCTTLEFDARRAFHHDMLVQAYLWSCENVHEVKMRAVLGLCNDHLHWLGHWQPAADHDLAKIHFGTSNNCR